MIDLTTDFLHLFISKGELQNERTCLAQESKEVSNLAHSKK